LVQNAIFENSGSKDFWFRRPLFGSNGLAPKLQATGRRGGLFRSNLLPIVSTPDFWCKAGSNRLFGARPVEVGPRADFFAFVDGEQLGKLLSHYAGVPPVSGEYTPLGRARITVEWLGDEVTEEASRT
jgi:hypothetical protein